MKFSKLALCLALLLAASTCFAQMYTVNDLGTLGGGWSKATAINASGQVVGTSVEDDLYQWGHAFRTTPNGVITNTDGLFAPTYYRPFGCITYTTASGINASGQVVGQMAKDCIGTDWYGFLTAPNGTIGVEIIGFDYHDNAVAINASGQALVDNFAYCWTYSIPSDQSISMEFNIGTLTPGGRWDGYPCSSSGSTYGYDINDLGQVVGASDIGDNAPFRGTFHAFRTGPNVPINPATDDLGTLGGTDSYAYAINAFGQVVGKAATSADNAYHAFRTSPNQPINPATDDLGPGSAYSIDDYGQVIGSAGLYSNGAWHDLNNYIAAAPNCGISPVDINDVGQIAANGGCSSHAVRLDPIYKAKVQQPINPDGSSVFSAKRGVIPVKFTLDQYNTPTCTLLPAAIGIAKAGNGTLAAVDESTYSMQADNGSNFRIDSSACQYIYNLSASALGVGTYRVDISINGIMVGHAVFAVK